MGFLDVSKLDGGAYLGNEVTLSRAQQQTPVWCWAAVIEAVISYRQGWVPQPEIVRQAFGGLVGGLPPALLSAVLNRQYVDFQGGVWQLQGTPLSTAPAALHREIQTRQQPVVLALSLPSSLHLVACIGVTGQGAILIHDPLESTAALSRELRSDEVPVAAYSVTVRQVRAPGA